jgi:hypothetical protein
LSAFTDSFLFPISLLLSFCNSFSVSNSFTSLSAFLYSNYTEVSTKYISCLSYNITKLPLPFSLHHSPSSVLKFRSSFSLMSGDCLSIPVPKISNSLSRLFPFRL